VNTLPLWTTATNIQSSAITQTGAGAAARVGIGTTTPASTLDVKGASTIRGTLSLPAISTATATTGSKSQAQDLVASSFNSGTHAAVNQTFQWQAEPAANNTASPSGTLNLLFASGAVTPAETGLKISNKLQPERRAAVLLFVDGKGDAYGGRGQHNTLRIIQCSAVADKVGNGCA